MRRSQLYLWAIVLFGAMTLGAGGQNTQGQNQNGKPRYATFETGEISMLVLSASAIAVGLALRRRRHD